MFLRREVWRKSPHAIIYFHHLYSWRNGESEKIWGQGEIDLYPSKIDPYPVVDCRNLDLYLCREGHGACLSELAEGEPDLFSLEGIGF